jgi:hypothetical protein
MTLLAVRRIALLTAWTTYFIADDFAIVHPFAEGRQPFYNLWRCFSSVYSTGFFFEVFLDDRRIQTDTAGVRKRYHRLGSWRSHPTMPWFIKLFEYRIQIPIKNYR